MTDHNDEQTYRYWLEVAKDTSDPYNRVGPSLELVKTMRRALDRDLEDTDRLVKSVDTLCDGQAPRLVVDNTAKPE